MVIIIIFENNSMTLVTIPWVGMNMWKSCEVDTITAFTSFSTKPISLFAECLAKTEQRIGTGIYLGTFRVSINEMSLFVEWLNMVRNTKTTFYFQTTCKTVAYDVNNLYLLTNSSNISNSFDIFFYVLQKIVIVKNSIYSSSSSNITYEFSISI